MFKPQYYLIKSAAALTVEHVIGTDRAKSKVTRAFLALPLLIALSICTTLLKHSVTDWSGRPYNYCYLTFIKQNKPLTQSITEAQIMCHHVDITVK